MDTVRPTHDLEAEAAHWQAWIEQVCRDLDVPAAAVDVTLIHALSKQVAHGIARPLAPVSTFILGMALGRAGDRAAAPTTASPATEVAAGLAARIAAHAAYR